MLKKLAVPLVLASVSMGADTIAIPPEALMAHVKYLSSDELAGRGNGTKGMEQAADYIAQQFKEAGLQPGRKDGSWFQRFDMVTGLTVGDGNRLEIQDGSMSVSFELGVTYYPLSATANDSSKMTSADIENIPLIFVGYGISAPSLDYDDYADVDLKGKAAVIFTHEPQEMDEKSRFKGRALTEYATLMHKAMTARSKGARAVVVISDPTHDTDAGAYRGFKLDPQADDFGLPLLRVQRARIAPLLQQWQLDATAAEIDRDGTPHSHPLPGSLTYVEHLVKTRRTVRNVIALLPGSDRARANEAVVVGAHYDHLGLGGQHAMNPELTGQIHNGADDNASGTAAVLEIARAAAAHRNRFPRTVVFVTFAGEELGLIGSAHYADDPVVPLDHTIAMINLDMVGRPRGKIMISGLEAAPALDDDVKAAASAASGLEVKRFQEGAGVGSSDDTTFLLKKIPSLAFFSGFHSDYHRPTDDWDRIDSTGFAQVATMALELTARLAQRAERPAYVAPSMPTHGAPSDTGSVGGYGPYFGSVPDFGESDNGVKFAEVRENSPAAKAGLRAGDVLVSFAGKPIRTLYDFTFALREQKPGDEVEVTVMREGQPLNVKVALTTRP
jgi:Peptidase family M28/PDZ domain/PA domain